MNAAVESGSFSIFSSPGRKPRIGIYEKALPAGISWQERLELAAEAGYDFVEMSVDETDRRLARLDWNQQERRHFQRTVSESGLSVPSMCLSGHRRFPLGSRDPGVRARAMEIMEKAIIFCVETGIRTIQLAGYDVYYEPGDAETRDFFELGLSQALQLAARENVMLSMETMDTLPMSSISRYMSLRASRKVELRSPWFSVYPDIGNLSAWGNNLKEELGLGIEYIAAVHLKDTIAVTSDNPGRFRDVRFGEGCVDFRAAFEILLSLNYLGPYVVEMWTEKSDEPLREVREARLWILDRMREAGYEIT